MAAEGNVKSGTAQIPPLVSGRVTPPADLMKAARVDLNEDGIAELVRRHGPQFTVKEMVLFIEEMRNDPGLGNRFAKLDARPDLGASG